MLFMVEYAIPLSALIISIVMAFVTMSGLKHRATVDYSETTRHYASSLEDRLDRTDKEMALLKDQGERCRAELLDARERLLVSEHRIFSLMTKLEQRGKRAGE